MNAAQGKHLWPLLFSSPALLACAGRISRTRVGGVRAALQPAQLQFCSPLYLIMADIKGLPSSLSEMFFKPEDDMTHIHQVLC